MAIGAPLCSRSITFHGVIALAARDEKVFFFDRWSAIIQSHGDLGNSLAPDDPASFGLH